MHSYNCLITCTFCRHVTSQCEMQQQWHHGRWCGISGTRALHDWTAGTNQHCNQYLVMLNNNRGRVAVWTHGDHEWRQDFSNRIFALLVYCSSVRYSVRRTKTLEKYFVRFYIFAWFHYKQLIYDRPIQNFNRHLQSFDYIYAHITRDWPMNTQQLQNQWISRNMCTIPPFCLSALLRYEHTLNIHTIIWLSTIRNRTVIRVYNKIVHKVRNGTCYIKLKDNVPYPEQIPSQHRDKNVADDNCIDTGDSGRAGLWGMSIGNHNGKRNMFDNSTLSKFCPNSFSQHWEQNSNYQYSEYTSLMSTTTWFGDNQVCLPTSTTVFGAKQAYSKYRTHDSYMHTSLRNTQVTCI